ncbi:hypothetical protein [Tepidibacter hydrothermalis]|uniref:Uncharacterized protein n=1 Tax=Tepidibacter hydrothermalis TaxID=3036126 RepID=A0ABY8E8Q8_9FIRM|nr:hypothetical protein [Tepidibacter hydrothermalis]WFD09290.1 hypothetical protein P4S50_12945 [Tepidibacter hydrothermalis]
MRIKNRAYQILVVIIVILTMLAMSKWARLNLEKLQELDKIKNEQSY